MLKEIEKATLKIQQAMDKNRAAYNEADEWYRDTGHDRYYNKMSKLNKEYEEMKEFLGIDKEEKRNELEGENAKLYKENKEIKMFLKEAKSLMDYIHADYWSDKTVNRLYEKFKEFSYLN